MDRRWKCQTSRWRPARRPRRSVTAPGPACWDRHPRAGWWRSRTRQFSPASRRGMGRGPSAARVVRRSAYSVQAADGGPGIDAHGWREFLETEPRAGLIRADLKRYTLAENVDRQFQVLDGRRTERKRLLRLRHARGIGEAGQRQVPCPLDKHGEIAE